MSESDATGAGTDSYRVRNSTNDSIKTAPTINLYYNTVARKANSERPSMMDLFAPPSDGNGAAAGDIEMSLMGGGVRKTSSMMKDGDEKVVEKPKTQFGMFEGVFARCLLNIWGVIMFLRVGWMVAHAG